MPRLPYFTEQPWNETYSEIIDVRSESEFAEDYLPGAINLPVLDDAQRVKVGTLYKQVSPFEARKVGAALVAQNIATHLNTHFVSKDKDYQPLLYCWRGGQRSNSMALVLNQIGWQATVITGGYKTYRTYVRDRLQDLPQHFSYWVLSGMTGSGKTYILKQIAQRGFQVLDLEALANHRGSLLGQEWSGDFSPQPSQKRFESLLLQELQGFDVNKPVWLEAESNKIGQVYLPSALWQQMKQARCVEIQLPTAVRVEWLLHEYPHLISHPELLKPKIERLKSRYGSEKIRDWYSLIDAGKWHSLVADLLTTHYDPAYSRSTTQCYTQVERRLSLTNLANSQLEALSVQLASLA
jgi:tRNA 2-selenouridine synthase